MPLHMCFDLFYGNFCMDLYRLTAMKSGNEALNTSSLQFVGSVKLHRFIASLLQLFLSVKRFIAVTFCGTTLFNASSPLHFKRNSSLNASSLLLFKVTLPTFAHNTLQVLSYRAVGLLPPPPANR